MRRITIPLILILLFSLLATCASADSRNYTISSEIVDPKPTIIVAFGEEEDPVTVMQHVLMYEGESLEDHSTLPVFNNMTDDQREYIFALPSQNYLFDEDYLFYIKARDKDENIIDIYIAFTINSDAPPIYLENPQSNRFDNDEFGVATTQVFDLIIRVEDIPASDCRWGVPERLPPEFNLDSMYVDPEILFSELNFFFDERSPDGLRFTERNFDYLQREGIPEGELVRIVVVCRGMNNDYSFAYPLEIGWDATAPLFLDTTSLNPSLIDDYSARETVMLVDTDDKTVCSYANTNRQSTDPLYYPSSIMVFENKDEDYTTSKDYDLSFRGGGEIPLIEYQTPGYPGPYDYAFLVTCENMAGLTATRTLDLSILFSEELAITTVSPTGEYLSGQVDFVFDITLTAYCQLTVEGEDGTSRNYEEQYGDRYEMGDFFSDGEYTYELYCEKSVSNDLATATRTGTFTVDTRPPERMEALFANTYPLCGDERTVTITLTATDEVSGVDYYEYVITGAGEEWQGTIPAGDGPETFTLDLEADFTAGDIIELQSFAVDEAGNECYPSFDQIYYYAAGDDQCDRVNPTTTALVEPTFEDGTFILTITCDDGEGSGCAGTVHSYWADAESQCDTNNIALYQDFSYYVDTPEEVSTIGQICYYVEDNAGNRAFGDAIIGLSDIFENGLAVTMLSPQGAYAGSRVNFTFTINQTATCELTLTNPEGFVDNYERQTSSRYHVIADYLAGGTYNYSLSCRARIGDTSLALGSRTGTFTVDDEGPTETAVVFTHRQPLCDNERTLTFTLEATDEASGVHHYEYTITRGWDDEWTGTAQRTGTQETVTIVLDAELQSGDIITIEAYAVDNVGNQGFPTSDTTEYYTSAYEQCDRTPPTTQAFVQPNARGDAFLLTITCDDGEGSGCDYLAHSYFTYNVDDECDATNPDLYTSTAYTIENPTEVDFVEHLCYYVEDNAGNRAFGDLTIIAAIGLELESPRFGISQNKAFNLIFRTYKDATCKWEFYNPRFHDRMNTAAELYNAIADRGFTTTGATTHAINGFPVDQSYTSYATDVVVACASPDGLYESLITEAGYDTTDPVVNIIIDPNALINPFEREADLTITVNEPSLCTYTRSPLAGDYQGVTQTTHDFYPEGSNPDDITQYTTYGYTQRLPENYLFSGTGDRFFLTDGYTYTYTATCTNLAGRTTQRSATLLVDHADTIAIDFQTPEWYREEYVDLSVSTAPVSTECYLSLEDLDEIPMIPMNADETNHSVSFSFHREGNYTLSVRCHATDDETLSGSRTRDIQVDFTEPSVPEIITQEFVCGLGETIPVLLSSDDGDGSGIHHYEYELTVGATTTSYTSTTGRFNIPAALAAAPNTISINAQAVDRAGLESGWSWEDAIIEILGTSSPECDETRPRGFLATTDTVSGIDVTIACVDDESGCDGYQYYELLPLGSDCEDAYYASEPIGRTITITDDQVLCWTVMDNNGNECSPDVCRPFDARVAFDMWLESPDFGIGGTNPYELIIGTDRAATCKIDFLSSNTPTSLSAWYQQLRYTFPQTGTAWHTYPAFDIVAMGAQGCVGRNECMLTFAVICLEGTRYHVETFELGYDTSDPGFTVAISNNPLYDIGLEPVMSVQSLNDDIWCRYRNLADGQTSYFGQSIDSTLTSNYKQSHTQGLGYFFARPDNQPYTINYEVTCINLAGRSVTRPATLTVSPTDDIGITINIPERSTSSSVDFEVNTLLQADCEYRLSPDYPYEPMWSSDGRNHEASIYFYDEGSFNLTVHCSQGLVRSGTATRSITADWTSPLMLDIISGYYTCSLSALRATLLSDASVVGLDYYNYSILDGSQNRLIGWKRVDATGTLEIEEQLQMVNNRMYYIWASAVDNWGRASSLSSTYVIASDQSNSECDFIDPQALLTIREVYGGVYADVECEDNESGCGSYFDFLHVPLASSFSCANGFYDTYYVGYSPFMDESGEACAIVYDLRGNEDAASVAFTVIDWCSNGIKDPEEEGLDCGYPCPTDCDQCSNGRWDSNEDGVDCGGVCPTDCSSVENCGNGVVNNGEECDTYVERTCEYFGLISGTLLCDDYCEYDTSNCLGYSGYCGDGWLNNDEECDGEVYGLTCNDLNLGEGSLACRSDCEFDTTDCEYPGGGYCGDGELGTGEECDGQVYLTCADIISGATGYLSCDAYCEYDTSGCTYPPPPPEGYCGDNVLDTGEDCDGGVGYLTCADFGFGTGTLACDAYCEYDTSGCNPYGFCGDGALDAGEDCDGSVGGLTCSDFGFGSGSLSCDAYCEFDTSGCSYPPPGGYCGDGTLDAGEFCDGSVYGLTCSDFGFGSGSLSCDASCSFDYSGCSVDPPGGYCGDGTLDAGEFCDGSVGGLTCSDFGFGSGSLSCDAYCEFDTSRCSSLPPGGYCGDWVINADEDCDGGLNGVSCVDFGFVSGNLACVACSFDTSACVPGGGGYCGDGTVDSGEDCDGSIYGLSCADFGFASGGLTCSHCSFDTSACVPGGGGGYCGDGTLDSGEFCDGGLNGVSCVDFGFVSGNLACVACSFDTSACVPGGGGYCGDGTVDSGEDCDGSIYGLSCLDFGFIGGGLACSQCSFDTSACVPDSGGYCGDGTLDEGEDCDGSVRGLTCDDFGFVSGTITCSPWCDFDTSSCTDSNGGYCGDGVIGANEECDGSVGGLSCAGLGLGTGSLSCTSWCELDTSGCSYPPPASYCGDGIADAGEDCDGSVYGLTCNDLNLGSGSLSCSPWCEFDTSLCSYPPPGGSCGDGVLGAGEECDSGVYGLTCSDFNLGTGNLACSPYCEFDTSGCSYPPPGGSCGDGVLGASEECDGGVGGLSCAGLGLGTGSLSCTSWCELDTSGCSYPPPASYCGDGIADAGEDCDGSVYGLTCADLGLGTGSLSCTSSCEFGTSGCSIPVPGGVCGDSVINAGEDCDGGVYGLTCADLGLGTGFLACSHLCDFDTSGCVPPSGSYCGDGTIDSGEDCDGSVSGLSCADFGFASGNLGCSYCSFDTSACVPSGSGPYCGDGTVDYGEDCDGSVSGLSCADFGFASGNLGCSYCSFDTSACLPAGNGPYCGDGIIDFTEDCDGSVYGLTCADLNLGSGSLSCTSWCQFDTSSCLPSGGSYCGDGTIDSSEDCDGGVYGLTCADFGFSSGELRCTSCDFDTSACVSVLCGNGFVDNGEDCDGGVYGLTCSDLGFASGSLSCSSCEFDTSSCTSTGGYCGDGTVNPGEECDGTVSSLTCADLGLGTGSLTCYPWCEFNTGACSNQGVGYCGDGLLQITEDCDGSVYGLSCSDLGLGTGSLSCSSSCEFNTAGCSYPPSAGYCGDGSLDSGEDCDGGVYGLSCSDLGFGSGSLGCSPWCEFDTSLCSYPPPGGYCGDGILSAGEECDGSVGSLTCTGLGLGTGSLSCTSWCELNTDGCSYPPPASYCGDSILDAGEDCDGGVYGLTCADLNLGSGSLSCTSSCEFGTSGCSVPVPGGVCGDSVINDGEDCDGGVYGLTCNDLNLGTGSLSCSAWCDFDTSGCVPPIGAYCGDGTIDSGEDCDGSVGGLTCLSFGFASGSLSCSHCSFDTSACVPSSGGSYCGDGSVDYGEDCDGSVYGLSCLDLGFAGGSLSCSSCEFDTSSCVPPSGGPYCGDGTLDAGEACDGSVNGLTCSDLGLGTGYLSCTSWCDFDTSGCSYPGGGYCGDGVLHLTEDCDGGVYGLTCADFGFGSGSLSCTSSCDFDTSGCSSTPPSGFCGDGLLDTGEDCDGGVYGLTCADFGFGSGSLSCTSWCEFDTSLCSYPDGGSCGDGSVGAGEDCDGGVYGLSCSDLGLGSGSLGCSPWCDFDTSGCSYPPGASYCGDGILDAGESCDGGVYGLSCSDLGLGSGSLTCSPYCDFDTTDCSYPPAPSYCGDGELGVGEDCDGGVYGLSCSDLGLGSGSLGCSPWCEFDTSLCSYPPPAGYCGDGVLSAGEECDGGVGGLSCAGLGLGTGSLSCTSWCELNTDSCSYPPPASYCGDGVLDAGEDCDGGVYGLTCSDLNLGTGSLSCTSSCEFGTGGCSVPVPGGVCGDSVINAGEDCDGGVYGLTCGDLNLGSGSLSCSAWCQFDTSGCVPPGGAYCGDGTIDSGEDCDGSVGGLTCLSFGFASGSLSCSHCSFDTSSCVPSSGGSYCGDGSVDYGEDCDGSVYGLSCLDLGFAGGSLSCSSCEFDTSGCTIPIGGYCGDGTLDAGEACDDSVNGLSCSDLSLGTGPLACTSWCEFDTSGCSYPGGGYCGDGSVGAGEDCEGSVNGLTCSDLGLGTGSLACTSWCDFDTSGCSYPPGAGYCGDGELDAGEDCDGSVYGLTCADFGLGTGSLSCTSSCEFGTSGCNIAPGGYCGDGSVGAGEDCDGDVYGLTCDDVGFVGGELHCSQCDFDTSSCVSAMCGDGSLDVGEDCDGSVRGLSCSDLGLGTGVLACSAWCDFDTLGCVPPGGSYCGDGSVDYGEDCDGGVYGLACSDFGFASGSLACTGCNFDTSGCVPHVGSYCGDGVVNVGEDCDGSVGNLACDDFGFASGNLACSYCSFDTSACVPLGNGGYCGDGSLDVGEDCDGSVRGLSCSDLGLGTGVLACSAWCDFDTLGCVPPGGSYCGDGSVDYGEDCDGGVYGLACSDFGFASGSLACTDCDFDTSSCTAPPSSYCGDGVLDAGEDCDGFVNGLSCSDFNLGTGSLSCTAWCELDTSDCSFPGGSYCGDGVLDAGEDCDGGVYGLSCADLNLGSGALSCTSSCEFNTAGCSYPPGAGYCGDGVLDAGEDCDGGVYGLTCVDLGLGEGNIACSPWCGFDTGLCSYPPGAGYCGDGVLGSGEECDGGVYGLSCNDIGLGTGALFCSSSCQLITSGCSYPPPASYCGDGVVDAGEDCDGGVYGLTCNDLNLGIGSISCTSSCEFGTSSCSVPVPGGYCGDGTINDGEDCDGGVYGLTCSDLNLGGGALSCTAYCDFDTSGCVPPGGAYCGDGTVDFGEDCDGGVYGLSCSDFGFASGSLTCSYCSFDTSECLPAGNGAYCGDGSVDFGEECDGGVYDIRCADLGFASGYLACSSCELDTSACVPAGNGAYCGDGSVDFGEDCDGGVYGLTCSDFGLGTGVLACSPWCDFDTLGCVPPGGSYCGDGSVDYGEDCDGGVYGLACSDFGFASGSLSCVRCGFDTSSCVPSSGTGYCGDGSLGAGEDCDGGVYGLTCSDLGLGTGVLACSPWCGFDTSLCSYPPPGGSCGDGVLGAGEDCDGSVNSLSCADLGLGTGTLRCTSWCELDTSSCSYPPPASYCGDGTADAGEDCDGGVYGLACSDLGLGTGTLSCTSSCEFGTGGCSVPVPGGVCGDNIINDGEDCDGGVYGLACSDLNLGSGSLSCSPWCQFDTSGCVPPGGSYCGDGTLDFGEQCDGVIDLTCSDLGFVGGALYCTHCSLDTSSCLPAAGGPYCGDGMVDFGEDCDGSVYGLTCEDLGFVGGILSCSYCGFDTSACVPPTTTNGICGDGAVDFGEVCDGGVSGLTCMDLGFVGGELRCTDCDLDASSCISELCGNGDIDLGEDCDGGVYGLSCSDFGFASGSLSCVRCGFDTSSCVPSSGTGYCGDGSLGAGEDCDGGVYGLTCSDLGLGTGNLACSSHCGFDTSLCSYPPPGGSCGDGVLGAGEECDGGVGGLRCTDLGLGTGTLRCTSWCEFDTSSCSYPPGASYCGDGTLDAGEDCDGGVYGLTCSDLSLGSGTLSCTSSCEFGTGGCSVPVPGGSCGDGTINTGEDCDGGVYDLTCNDLNLGSGSLTCSPWCDFDTSGCIPPEGSYCGDGNVDFGEDCDGGVSGLTCADIGFASGSLSCSYCSFDTSACLPANNGPYCGDGNVDFGEECDGGVYDLTCSDLGFIGGELSCSFCGLDTSACTTPGSGGVCGDGNVDFGEDCDGDVFALTCADMGFLSGTLHCYECDFDASSCVSALCGNGVIDLGEDCDGGVFGLTCEDLDFVGGDLACSQCDLDTSACDPLATESFCGDGRVDYGEDCDGGVFGLTCEDMGFIEGEVSCSDCDFDTSHCISEFCGNGVIDFGEDCDGDVYDLTCEDIGFISGELSCSDCDFDTKLCVADLCGNGVVDKGEQCDGGIGSMTCEDFSLTSGTLSCNNKCLYDTYNCEGIIGTCGDGIIGRGETCDGTTSKVCEDFSLRSGETSCEDCMINTFGCLEGYCGNGKIDPGETCDGTEWGDISNCADLSEDFASGMPTCDLTCHFDTSTCREQPIEDPDEEEEYLCFSDIDCPSGYTCVDNMCRPGDEQSACETDEDCLPGETCANGLCWPPEEPESHTAGIILLITGLVSLLGGAGYIVYTTFIMPPPPARAPAGQGGVPIPQPQLSPEEMEKRRAAQLAAMQEKMALQEEAKRRAQTQKAKQRQSLLSAFQEEPLKPSNKAPAKKPAATRTPASAAAASKPSAPKQAASKTAAGIEPPTKPKDDSASGKPAPKQQPGTKTRGKDVFKELDSIAKDAAAGQKTSEQVFQELSSLTGHTVEHVQETLEKEGVRGKDVADLYKDAEKKDVNPKTVTPTLTHLVENGNLEHKEAKAAVHHLASQEKLTEKQKTKILDDLEKLEG